MFENSIWKLAAVFDSSTLILSALSAVPVNCEAVNDPLIFKFPEITVLPVLDATVNLSVVPFLTAKFASTLTALLNSDVPVTVRFPPRVVAPLLTLSVPVD